MIYLDNAGTTKPLNEVTDLTIKLNEMYYFNPSGGYKMAHKTRDLINEARENIANKINANSEGIIFTSCATESNNQVIRSLVNSDKKSEYIFSEGEHPSVYNTALDLKNSGHIVHFIHLKKDGTINEEILLKTINENTRFISIMAVSNETGAINDVVTLSKKIKEKYPKIFIHSDCVQALGKIDINFKKSSLDAITLSSHKINGLKGAGALCVKKLDKIKPFLIGGGQENNYRSGTENIDAICSFGLATKLIDLSHQNEIYEMSKYIKDFLNEKLGDKIIIVSGKNCVPNIISIIFKRLKGEVFVRELDDYGVVCSKGSACSTKKSGNRTLESMGYSKEEIIGNLRISLGRFNTMEEVKQACEIIVERYNSLKERMKI